MGATGRSIMGVAAGLAAGLAAALALLAAGLPAPAQADSLLAQRVQKGPPVPFEVELARQRGDRSFLSFDEHIANVPGPRIRDLPTVNGRMGDRVVVGEGHMLHFPVGYLATATYRFDSHRARPGSQFPASAAELEPNPAYALVGRFDTELGRVCARTQDRSSGTVAEFRLGPEKTLALVLDRPGRFDALTRQSSRSYVVFAGTDERYVALDQTARRLLAHCRSGAASPDIPHDGAPLDEAVLTGLAG